MGHVRDHLCPGPGCTACGQPELSFTIHREARANAFEEVRRWALAEERDTRKLLQARQEDPTMQVALHGRLGQLHRLTAFLDEREGDAS